MYHFNIMLTELCNANCSHCYMSSIIKGKRRTLTFDQIDIIISKLPDNTSYVTLTGGEVFLVNDLLKYTISSIKKRNCNIKIELESNGIYVYECDTLRKLRYLKQLGVDSIRFSLDPFHKDGGVDLDKVKSLIKYQSDDTPEIKYLIQEKALALGKATALDSGKLTQKDCMNSEKSEFEPYLFLDISGNVYTCAWKCIPPVGNLLVDKFEDIQKNMSELFNKMLLTGKIEAAIAIKKNVDVNTLKQLSKKYGQCYLCIKKYWGE